MASPGIVVILGVESDEEDEYVVLGRDATPKRHDRTRHSVNSASVSKFRTVVSCKTRDKIPCRNVVESTLRIVHKVRIAELVIIAIGCVLREDPPSTKTVSEWSTSDRCTRTSDVVVLRRSVDDPWTVTERSESVLLLTHTNAAKGAVLLYTLKGGSVASETLIKRH